MHGDLVADVPVTHCRTGAHDYPGRVRSDDVIIERVALSPEGFLAQAVQEPERGERLEDARPDRVEVDRGGHDRDEDLVGGEFGSGTSSTWRLRRGSLSALSIPSNIVCSSRRTKTARVTLGISVAANSSAEAPERTASRISLIWARLVGAALAPVR